MLKEIQTARLRVRVMMEWMVDGCLALLALFGAVFWHS